MASKRLLEELLIALYERVPKLVGTHVVPFDSYSVEISQKF